MFTEISFCSTSFPNITNLGMCIAAMTVKKDYAKADLAACCACSSDLTSEQSVGVSQTLVRSTLAKWNTIHHNKPPCFEPRL